jgi:signal transduction histidine kinase
VAGEFMTRTGEKSVELVLELAPRLPIIEGDARWLYRAIRYLVENALRFTPAGGMITLRTFTRAPYVALEVADTGAGIPPDILPYIFERFYKGSRARTQDGSGAGLGLAVVKKIVMLHGGCVEAESVVDAGSTFRILLPPGTLTP